MSELSLEEQAAVSQKEVGKVEALPVHSMKKDQELETEYTLEWLEYSDEGQMRSEGEEVGQN